MLHPTTTAVRSTVIGGVPVDDVTMKSAIDIVWSLVQDGRATGRTHQVATVNVDFVVNARQSTHLSDLLWRTSLSIPDGQPIVWAARLVRGRLRERVAGSDLVPALAESLAERKATLVLYGAGPGVAHDAARILRDRFPGVEIIGEPAPNISAGSIDDAALERLRSLGADICCVALGNPKQELFIDRYRDVLGIPVLIGIGAALDFIVGDKRRAPVWMQRTGLEWLHRLATEPRRLLRRYSRDVFVYLPVMFAQALRGRRRTSNGRLSIITDESGVSIELCGLRRLDNSQVNEVVGVCRDAHRRGTPVRIRGDLARLEERARSLLAHLVEGIDLQR